ncbi:MAG: outer membrane protein assembly factor BamA [Nitrospinales bacterium]
MPSYAQEGETVSVIKIQGNKRVDDSTILFYIKTKVGEPLLRRTVREDIKRIYDLGQFKDIRVETEQTPRGLEVIFLVREKSSVGDIEVTGGGVIEITKLLELIGVERGDTFNESMIQEIVQKVTQEYHDKGYFYIKVKVETRLNKDNQVDLLIRLDEGHKVSIEKIRFTGNKAFSDKEILKVIETSETDWLSFFNDSGIYKKDVLKIDLLRIEGLYQDHGYLKIRVLEPRITLDKDKKDIFITIPVEEGPQYRIGKIQVQEDDTYSAAELRAALQIKEGKVYNMSELREDILTITEMYSQKGYAYADVNPVTNLNEKEKVVDLAIRTDRGRKVFVGQINIKGNEKTWDNVIRREFRLKEGQVFNSDKLKRSRQRINNLGFFSDVKVDTKPGSAPDLIDIDASVVEKPTGSFSLGAGFSSVDNFIFNGSIAQNNLFGRGQRLNFSAQLSSRRTNFNLNFTEPRLFDTNILLGVDLFNNQSNFFSFSSRNVGAGLRFGKSLGEFDWGGLNYRFEKVKVSDVNPFFETPFLSNGTRTTSRITPTYIYDSRDNFLNPTTGWRHVASVDIGGLGGIKFFRSNYEITYYRPLLWKFVLALHGELGIADGYSGDKLPVFEHYFMGGAQSLRGFTIRQVGPKDGTGNPIGGDQSLLFNLEVVYPVARVFRVFVFHDRGNVYGDGADVSTTASSIDLSKMRKSVGGGVRFQSPFGPIGIAYGIKLDQAPGDTPAEFHFTAGGSF